MTRPWTMSKSKLSMALRSAESSCVCIGLGASARGGERGGVAGGTGVGEGWFAGGDVRGGVVGGSDVGEGWLAGGLAGAVIARGGGVLSGRSAWRGEEVSLGVLEGGLPLGRTEGLFLLSVVMGIRKPTVSGRAAARALSRMAVVVAMTPP